MAETWLALYTRVPGKSENACVSSLVKLDQEFTGGTSVPGFPGGEW